MISKKIITITVTLAIVLFVAGVLLNFTFNGFHPVSTPVVGYSHNFTTLNTKDMNVSQGTTLLMNLSFTSMVTYQQTIPLYNLQLIAYNDTIDYLNWDVANWNSSIIQERVFNFSFRLSQLTLQPLESNSSILTINLAEDAPVGRYETYLNIGSIKDEVSGITYLGSIPIEMIIIPKSE